MLDPAAIKELGRMVVVLTGFATIAFIGHRLLFGAKIRGKAKMHVESICYKFTISGVNSGVVCVILASLILIIWLLADCFIRIR